jgi:hypothetical protein
MLRMALAGLLLMAITEISISPASAQSAEAVSSRADAKAANQPAVNESSAMQGRKGPRKHAMPLPAPRVSSVKTEASIHLQRNNPRGATQSTKAAIQAVHPTAANLHPVRLPSEVALSGTAIRGACRQKPASIALGGPANKIKATSAVDDSAIHASHAH